MYIVQSYGRAMEWIKGFANICKFERLKWVIMGNNRTQCNNDVIIRNNSAITEACPLHNR